MRRITAREIKDLREQYLKEQHYHCALCNESLAQEEAVLDHDHRSGQIRSVLHRGCNAFLGHIENNQARNRITDSRLTAILGNLQRYVQELKPLLHSTYRTPEERALRAKKRAKSRKANK